MVSHPSSTSVVMVCLIVLLFACSAAAQTTDNYAPGPDSKPQPGVPKGEIIKLSFDKSKIFPDTVRDYWIYVPAQYKPDKPACVFVMQDGIRFEAPTAFDNLINKKEIPITIGVFVAPGVVKTADGNTALDRFNRSFEYDGLGDAYARFLLDESFPSCERRLLTDVPLIFRMKETTARSAAARVAQSLLSQLPGNDPTHSLVCSAQSARL